MQVQHHVGCFMFAYDPLNLDLVSLDIIVYIMEKISPYGYDYPPTTICTEERKIVYCVGCFVFGKIDLVIAQCHWY